MLRADRPSEIRESLPEARTSEARSVSVTLSETALHVLAQQIAEMMIPPSRPGGSRGGDGLS